MSEETQGKTCKKCGQDKKSCPICNQKKQFKINEPKEKKKPCKSCNKAVRQLLPVIITTIVFTTFFVYGVYEFIKYLIGLFSN